MSLNQLLDQFLGSGQPAATNDGQTGNAGQNPLSGMLPEGVSNQMLGGLAAGGLLGLLVGNKKIRKTAASAATGVVGVGATAALGVLAYKAYQNWQGTGGPTGATPAPSAIPNPPIPDRTSSQFEKRSSPPTAPPVPMRSWDGSVPPTDKLTALDFDATQQLAADGSAFQAVLIKAMIAAANADHHIDAKEQFAIFELIKKMQLDPEDQALVFKTLQNPPGINEISRGAANLEQASEIYLVSRLAIDADHPLEQAYLQNLSAELGLPPELVSHLEGQLQANSHEPA